MLTSLLFILFTVFDYAFDFWPLFLITPLFNRKNGLRSSLYVWSIWAVIRIFLFFNPLPGTKSLLLPEPLNTTYSSLRDWWSVLLCFSYLFGSIGNLLRACFSWAINLNIKIN